jgi:hypothetical protein
MARGILFCVLCLLFFGMKGQDKIYYLDGNTKSCNITSLTDEYINIETNGAEEAINKSVVLLIEYRNGSIEVINLPRQDATFNPKEPYAPSEKARNRSDYKLNYASLNTLALCNADVAGFYEYMPKGQMFSFGVMGAYNFNLNATFQNNFLSRLSNAKKNYDIGATFNVFPFELTEDIEIYLGVMIKYTDFSFDKVKIDSVKVSGGYSYNVSYSPAKGSQLATIITIGTHTFLSDQFFIRTIAGLGAFKLKGEYKEQFNMEINKNKTPAETFTYNFLPKMYLGINLGFNF